VAVGAGRAQPWLGMPLVRVRILLGASLLGAPARSFADDTTVQIVIDKALEDRADCNVTWSLAMYPSANEKPETNLSATSRSKRFAPMGLGSCGSPKSNGVEVPVRQQHQAVAQAPIRRAAATHPFPTRWRT
jgi:hypothetical protein